MLARAWKALNGKPRVRWKMTWNGRSHLILYVFISHCLFVAKVHVSCVFNVLWNVLCAKKMEQVEETTQFMLNCYRHVALEFHQGRKWCLRCFSNIMPKIIQVAKFRYKHLMMMTWLETQRCYQNTTYLNIGTWTILQIIYLSYFVNFLFIYNHFAKEQDKGCSCSLHSQATDEEVLVRGRDQISCANCGLCRAPRMHFCFLPPIKVVT